MDGFSIYKHEVPFVRVLIPFALGILSFYNYKSDWLLIQLVLIILILTTVLLIKKHILKNTFKRRYKGVNGTIVHILFFFTGSLCTTSYKKHNFTDYKNITKQKHLKIKIISEPQIRQNIILFNALISKSQRLNICKSTTNKTNYNSKSASDKIRVIIIKNTSLPLSLKYGDELIIRSKLVETDPPSNPFEFDFKSWLANQNIYYQATLKQSELIKLNTNTGNKLISFALQLREKQIHVFRRLIKNDDAFAIAATLILGYRSDLSAETLDIYSKTGTIHVLSVSGMHVGLIYLVLSYVIRFLKIKPSLKIAKTIFMLLTIWFYALLTGFSPSVLRASIMISVFIISKLFTKTTNNYNIIAFAAFCILLYNPFLIWDIGFQLSFMAVLGLIYLQPKIEQWLPLESTWLAKLWSIVAMSLAAQLATYPFSVYYFHHFPTYFLISNLFITIPSALIMYLGIIILLFELDGLAPFFEWLIIFTNTGLNQIASLPFSGITSIWLNKIELTLLCLSIFMFIKGWVKSQKQVIIISFILFLAFQSSISYDKIKAMHQKKTIKLTLHKNYAYTIISGRYAILFTNFDQKNKAYNYSIKPVLDKHRVTQIIFKNLNVTGF